MSEPAYPRIAVTLSNQNIRRILRIAWLGMILGVGIELALLTIRIWQNQLPDTLTIAADTVQKMTWSSLICIALCAGLAASKARAATAGIAGLFGAPAAFLTASILHKALQTLLAAETLDLALAWFPAAIKGMQYAALGTIIANLSVRGATWKHYVLVGTIVGIAFYALSRWWLPAQADPLQQAIIDITHPIGCALAVYLTSRVDLYPDKGSDSIRNALTEKEHVKNPNHR